MNGRCIVCGADISARNTIGDELGTWCAGHGFNPKVSYPKLSPDDITKLESLLLADTDPDADHTVKTAASTDLETGAAGDQNATNNREGDPYDDQR